MADDRGGREAVENAAPGQGGRKTSMTVAEARGHEVHDAIDRASPRGQAELVLGKGVHPAALDRLFELWPEATASVMHDRSRHDGVDLRITTVILAEGVEGMTVAGLARCRLDCDNYDRRKGIDLAFRRALLRAKQVTEGGGTDG